MVYKQTRNFPSKERLNYFQLKLQWYY